MAKSVVFDVCTEWAYNDSHGESHMLFANLEDAKRNLQCRIEYEKNRPTFKEEEFFKMYEDDICFLAYGKKSHYYITISEENVF